MFDATLNTRKSHLTHGVLPGTMGEQGQGQTTTNHPHRTVHQKSSLIEWRGEEWSGHTPPGAGSRNIDR